MSECMYTTEIKNMIYTINISPFCQRNIDAFIINLLAFAHSNAGSMSVRVL
jgi:hypothetical protein